MTAYVLCMLAGLAAATALYAVRLGRSKVRQALLTAGLSAVLGIVCAKQLFVLVMAPSQFSRYGLAALIHPSMEEMSVFGGALGVILAAVLAARICRMAPGRALDLFAPSAALLLAVTRASEYFLGSRFLHQGLIGMGADLPDNSWACFFPLAVQDEWDMWFYAIFMLETLVAVIALVLSLTVYRKRCTFLRTVFFIMALQIYSESLHNQSIRWGFVRVEQLLCAVGLMTVVVLHCLACRKQTHEPVKKAFFWCLPLLALFGLVVGIEFALDKTTLSHILCYGVMLAAIACMLVIEHIVYRQRSDIE